MVDKYARIMITSFALIASVILISSNQERYLSFINRSKEDESLGETSITLHGTGSDIMVVSDDETTYTIDYLIGQSVHIIKGKVASVSRFGNIASEYDVEVVVDYGENMEYIESNIVKVYGGHMSLEEGKTYYMFLRSIEYDWIPNRVYHPFDYRHGFINTDSVESKDILGSKDTDAFKQEVLLTEEMFVEKLDNFSAPKDLSSPFDKVMLTSDEMNMEQAIEAADVCAIGKVVRVSNVDKYSNDYSIVLTQALKGDMILYSEDDVQLMIDSKYEPWFQRVFIYTRKGVAEVGDEVVLLLKKVDESSFPYEVFSVYSFLPREDETAAAIEKLLN